MEYDLLTIKPSQERRLMSALKTEDGRTEFARKLGHFLSVAPTGGEADLDQTTSLATRLSALGVWDSISSTQLETVSEHSNDDRLAAFRKGVPARIAPHLRRVRRTVATRSAVSGSKRDQLIAKYAEDLRKKVGLEPDMDLLTKVTIACGPTIYQRDLATIAATQSHELERMKSNFLVGKLGLPDSPKLMDWINSVIDDYGRSERNKYRAVIYYLLVHRLSRDESTVKWVKEHQTKEKPAQRWLIES